MKHSKHTETNKIPNPILEKIDKKEFFSTPPNYFESLLEDINNKKLINKNIRKHFDILSYRVLAPTLSIIVILTLYFNYSPTPSFKSELDAQMSEIIYNEMITFDDEILVEEFAEILTNETENAMQSDEEIIDYLINNNININSIIEEYEN